MMWEDYVYDISEKKIRIGTPNDQFNSAIIYLGRFLSWEEANDSFNECNYEK